MPLATESYEAGDYVRADRKIAINKFLSRK